MPSWARVATRSRVPLGFVFAAVYLWFARPDWISLGLGFVIAMAGVLVRAAGFRTHTEKCGACHYRPLCLHAQPALSWVHYYCVGFIVAARNVWIGVATLAMFAFIYLPVIKAEEKYLRSTFSGYDAYASAVPRLFPRLTRYRPSGVEEHSQFSAALYMRHREYNAAIGSILMLGALVVKILVKH